MPLTARSVTVPGADTGAVTVTVAVPPFPSLVAVMVAEPAALAPTSPLPLTVATPELLVVQVMVRPVSAFPFASFALATSGCVPPTDRLAVAGVTATDATETRGAVLAVDF